MATHSSILAAKSHGQRSLVGYSPLGRKELDTTEQLHSLKCCKSFFGLWIWINIMQQGLTIFWGRTDLNFFFKWWLLCYL